MKVADIMSTGIEAVKEEESVATAAKKMRDINVGALPVTNDENKLSGIITDRDIVVRTIAEGKDPNSAKVKDGMTSGVVSCPSEQSVEDALALMEKEQIRRLVVLDQTNNAVGILALGDLAVKVPGNDLTGEVVEEVSKPAQPER